MRLAGWPGVLVVACVVVGCALPAPRADPSTFFALAASEPSPAVPAGSWDVALGLGPVAIPGYLTARSW